MRKDINISIETIQNDESTIWESKGLLFKEEDIYIVLYPDYAGNTQTDNRLELSPNSMRLIRNGAFTSDMIFEENIMSHGKYNVMFYNADIDVFTNSYSFSERDNTLEACIDYQLFDSNNEIVHNKMKINITTIL